MKPSEDEDFVNLVIKTMVRTFEPLDEIYCNRCKKTHKELQSKLHTILVTVPLKCVMFVLLCKDCMDYYTNVDTQEVFSVQIPRELLCSVSARLDGYLSNSEDENDESDTDQKLDE